MPKINGPLLRRTRRGRDESVEVVAPHLGIAPGTLRNIEGMRAEAGERLIGRIVRYYDGCFTEEQLREVPKAPAIKRRSANPIKRKTAA